jgi:hypothetical protein
MFSVDQLSDTLHVTPATVYRWISEGKLDASKTNGTLTILESDKNRAFWLSEFEKRRNRPPVAWVPKEIKAFDKWHHLLDELIWLLKVSYGDPGDIRKKAFRLDRLLQSFITTNKVTLAKVRNTFASISSSKASVVLNDLKRGWYNELAYSFPLRPSTLRHSYSDLEQNKAASNVRLAFPSWRITTAYYSVYFYLRAVTLIKQSGFRLEQHGATIECFKNGVMNPLANTLWRFPFSIAFVPGSALRMAELPCATLDHMRYGYVRHPRAPHRTPADICRHIYQAFRSKGKAGKRPSTYSLFDYLHDFRVWANYLDIDNMLSLWGQGYKAFLDQNLAALLFFIGAIADLSVMAVLGSDVYMRQLQRMYDLFAANNPELETSFGDTPLCQRLDLFRALQFTDGTLLRPIKENINKVSVN